MNEYSTNIDWTTIIISILSAVIAGFFAWLATKQAHQYNQKLEKEKLDIYEKATALSIIEELKVLKESYETEMDNAFLDLTENKYLTMYYTITQDFFTVFTQNASEIGLISDKNLRNSIIKSYIYIKRYLEDSIIYKKKLDEFITNRNNFIERVYPTLINGTCSKANTTDEINLLIDKVKKDDWTWLNSQYLNQAQAMNFFNSDANECQNLISLSQALRNRYFELKESINNTIEIAQKIYKEQ